MNSVRFDTLSLPSCDGSISVAANTGIDIIDGRVRQPLVFRTQTYHLDELGRALSFRLPGSHSSTWRELTLATVSESLRLGTFAKRSAQLAEEVAMLANRF